MDELNKQEAPQILKLNDIQRIARLAKRLNWQDPETIFVPMVNELKRLVDQLLPERRG